MMQWETEILSLKADDRPDILQFPSQRFVVGGE